MSVYTCKAGESVRHHPPDCNWAGVEDFIAFSRGARGCERSERVVGGHRRPWTFARPKNSPVPCRFIPLSSTSIDLPVNLNPGLAFATDPCIDSDPCPGHALDFNRGSALDLNPSLVFNFDSAAGHNSDFEQLVTNASIKIKCKVNYSDRSKTVCVQCKLARETHHSHTIAEAQLKRSMQDATGLVNFVHAIGGGAWGAHDLQQGRKSLTMELPNFQLRYQTLKANHGQSVFHENINKSKHG
ncbi:hypothetical protein EVAR_33338_1 [Eumeta japonica]|uniref:Uncharacterized protein n=1 Tax=Eumeta variegata TaxID=151549 RepID=A0A4C1YLQ8_EUMVA|nr:hypothetical protein EVAR_33338_1 [Eumeta japonica]